MARKKISMDGNTAAAHASYAFTEVAGIYPITPSSVMADVTDTWSATGLTASIHVGVVTEDVECVGSYATSGYVEHARE